MNFYGEDVGGCGDLERDELDVLYGRFVEWVGVEIVGKVVYGFLLW